ncbi:hypothetical protein ACEPAI_9166 [Sanghuangporus weigelae]
MHAIAALFALLLTFATQGVFCFFKNVNFSTPEQCGPFTVDFSNASEPPVLPLSLTIVPISAIPISVQLPEDSWDNSTNAGMAHITFLPFSSGTRFIASLDDGTGASVALVSDVIAVQDSNASTCLGPNQKSFPFYFIHDGNLNQCSRFNVTFNPSMIKNPPAIRAFLPRSFSFPVNATDTPVTTMTSGSHSSSNDKDKRDDDKGNDDGKGKDKDDDDDDDDDDKSDKDSNGKSDNNNSGKDESDNDKDGNNGSSSNSGNNNGGSNNNSDNGNNGSGNPFNNSSNNDPSSHGPFNISSKEYLLNIMHGFQAVLTFDDGDGHRGSSQLFTAGGTSSSPSGCFKENFNIPSSTPDVSSSSSAGEGGKSDGLSRTGKIVISVLGSIIGVSLAVILFILCRKRWKARKDLEKTSFVFTEDIDMGSSFATTFTSRIRARISHMTYGKRSLRSYRSYRDEKDGASTWIPTSPIGSPAPLTNSPQAEKRSSWIDFGAVLGNVPPEGLETSSARYSRTLRAGDMNNSIIPPSLEFNYPAPRVSTDVYRLDKSDIRAPVVSRSSESSRFLLGSGYLSSRSSETGIVTRKNTRLSILNSLPSQSVSSNGRRDSAAILSTNFSSSGYMHSRSSSATMDREPEPRQINNEIYVSSPIRPAPDVPDSISPSQSDSGTIQRPSTVITRDVGSRISILKGNLRRDGPPRERGRILPFPTVSLRMSRSPRSSPG